MGLNDSEGHETCSEFLTGFGANGPGPGQINHAIAVAVTDDNTVFVADFGNNRIEKWRQEN